jgi:ribosomal-protein-alanine N-acetyltransferase
MGDRSFRMPLRTSRLVLRRLEATDAPVLQRLAGEYEIARWTAEIPHPYDIGMARDFVAWSRREFDAGRRYDFALIERRSGGLVGIMSMAMRGSREGELGYWIGLPYQRQGYASEAAARIIDLAFGELSVPRVTASCLPENEASWRVMESCGMRYLERINRWAPARRETLELLFYAIDRPAVSEA